MAVPYLFSAYLGGGGIPLAQLDANFAYLTSGNPVLTNLTLTGNLTVGGTSTFNGASAFNSSLAINGPLTIDGFSVNPTGVTGTGLLVFNTGPTLVAPNLGSPASGMLTNCVGLPLLTGISGFGVNVANFLAFPTSSNLALAVTDETGSGSLVFNTNALLNNPTLTAPILGTPASGNLTNCTNYPATALNGIVPLINGGTGASTQQAALNNLLPPQSPAQAQYVLTTDGAGNITWNYNEPGTVSSVALDPSTTGLTVNGGTSVVTITTTGTFTLGGTLAIANGGTNATTQQNAINNLAGSVTAANYLRGNGTNVVMSPIQLADITALGTLSNNTTGSSATFTSTTQNSQFSSIVVSGNVTAATFLYGTTNIASIGVNQSWNDVTGGRVVGGTYTNSSGRPIMVSLSLNYTGGLGNCDAYVNGVIVGSGTGNVTYKNTESFVFIVPPSNNYTVTGAGVVVRHWSELS